MTAFPIASLVLARLFPQGRFTGAAVHACAISPGFPVLPDGVGPGLGAVAGTVGTALPHVPLFLAVGLLHAVRAPLALVGYLVPVVASVVAVWTGLRFTPVALTLIPRGTGRRALAAVGAAQLAPAWVWPPLGPGPIDRLTAILP